MRILWVTNTIFPDLAHAMGTDAPVIGGWMYGLAKSLRQNGVQLVVATAVHNTKKFKCVVDNIEYHLLNSKKPITQYDSSLEQEWEKLIQSLNPDLVHIHGTEYAHGLALMNAYPQLNYVISIQGMIGAATRYYLGGISRWAILKSITLRDILKWDTLFMAQKKFRNRSKNIETEYLKRATDIIGRTQWDHDHVKTVNANITYHFCNEILRDDFYIAPHWNTDSKSDHTIFLSQTLYPLKGLHKVLEAINLLKTSFPQIQLRIAGYDITRMATINDRLRIGGYGNYIRSIIHKYQLQKHITFTGRLSAEGMIGEYLKCNVFVCPSCIENSPNSLGEAQLLGTPCIAAYVGGVPNMIEHMVTGILYRFEEVEMLAKNIERVFLDPKLTSSLSNAARAEALKRHDRRVNTQRNLEIYQTILAGENNVAALDEKKNR